MRQSSDTSEFVLRPIGPRDDSTVENLIRTVMPEFGASGPGFAIHDPEVSKMYEYYQQPRWAYYVLLRDGRVVGGGGFAPLEGGDEGTCELKKMYFLPEVRGFGWGSKLLKHCLDEAKKAGFRKCYLETLSHMTQARALYEKNGFEKLSKAMGNTGHFGCNNWYLKEL